MIALTKVQKNLLLVGCFLFLGNSQVNTDYLNNQETHKLIHYRVSLPQTYYFENIIIDRIPELSYMYRLARIYIPDYASFFIAIKIEESGADYKPSWLAKTHNNLTGMRYPNRRETYAIGSTQSNYAIYRNWFECMLDFKIYMEIIEQSFVKKHQRKFKDDFEMLDYLFNYYNAYDKWYQDMQYLIRYVHKKFIEAQASERTDEIIKIPEYEEHEGN